MFHHHHSSHTRETPIRTSFSGSLLENPLNISIHDIRSASNTHLRHLQGLIEKELHHRSLAKPYFIVEKSDNYLLAEEAKVIEDEEIPRYIRCYPAGEVLKLHITADSIFHQTPDIGQVYEIYIREGNIIDVARRVATHG